MVGDLNYNLIRNSKTQLNNKELTYCINDVRVVMCLIQEKIDVKDVKKKGEAAKVAIRNIRRDGNDDLKKAQKAGEITEDDLKTETDKLQKLTDKYIEEINKAFDAKDKDIMQN